MISDRLVAERYARRNGLYLGRFDVQEFKWWNHWIACMRMPRGGLNGTGSQSCSFEFSAPSQGVLDRLMEGLPFRERQVFDQESWVPSRSIDTFYALTPQSLDSYLQLHHRPSLARIPGLYRGTRLIAPPASKTISIALSAVPPLLIEVCHRSGHRIELVVTFKLFVLSDLDSFSMPPTFQYATGMDSIFRCRALKHVKELSARGAKMSSTFEALAGTFNNGSEESDSESHVWEESEAEELNWPQSPDARSDSDSASDAAFEEMLEASDEKARAPLHATHPRAAHKRKE